MTTPATHRIYLLLQVSLEKEEALLFLGHPRQKINGFKQIIEETSRCPQRLVGKAVKALPAIVRIVVGIILSFLGKAVGFVAEHKWA